MGNFDSFADYLEREFVGEVKEAASDKVKMVATDVLKELVYTTPVDTSKALSNWQVGIGSPVSNEIEAYAQGQRGSTAGTSSAEALAVGIARLSARKVGEPVYISNLADYIVDLNDGASGQAAPGFVERAVRLGQLVAGGA